jgi:hypothetical protein
MKVLRAFAVILLCISVPVGMVAGCWALGRCALDRVTGFDRHLYRQYGRIRPGMTRQEVVRRMGEPRKEETQFHLWIPNGYEEEYDRADKSGSKYYLYWWDDSMEDIYAVGFNTNGVATMKATGTTDPPPRKTG